MSITAQFGTCTDDKRKITKSFSSTITASASVYGDISILSPRLLVEYNSGIFSCNYCYIPEYNRYYYITNVNLSSGDRMIVSCSVDPLMSFSSEILSLNVTVTRQEYADDNFLPDNFMTPTSRKNVEVYKIENNVFNVRGGNAHSSENFILCLASGYHNEQSQNETERSKLWL